MMLMDKEFNDKCLNEKTITQKASVTSLKRKEDIDSTVEKHKNSSDYFIDGARSMLQSKTPLLAVLLGYFAMEHKANQLLALHGYKVESHICTQIGISRIVGRKDLAQKLSIVFTERQEIGYRLFSRENKDEHKYSQALVDNEIVPFLEEVDKLIKDKQEK